jgi:D-alanyl-D-alanine carboxypeptidase
MSGITPALAATLFVPGSPGRPAAVTARAAIIMDAATGDVLWERNASDPLPPASTTKVLTAIVALESGRLDESFRVSEDAADTAPSKINLRPGQRMRLRNLLYAVLLNSANDAASVVAEGLAGSEAAFAARMNARARELGATASHFVNPHGLTSPGHVASARDLAVIFRHGLRNPLFREILETGTSRCRSSRAACSGSRSIPTTGSSPATPTSSSARPATRDRRGVASSDPRRTTAASSSSRSSAPATSGRTRSGSSRTASAARLRTERR